MLFAINAWVCGPLWTAGFIDQMGSSEGPVLALIRHILRHWGDLTWFPVWLDGMPFTHVYNPGLHATTAWFASLFSLSPERAYHIVAALLYALGPVTLYWLCWRFTGSRAHAFFTGLLYSLFSLSGALAATTRQDMGGWLHARRYQVLVHYGEGPHLAVLTLIPLAIWALDRAVRGEKRAFLPLAAMLLGACVATNWTGSIGLTLAVAAYLLSQLGSMRPARWLVALGIAAVAYLLICPWVPPSAVAQFPANAQNSAGTAFGARHLLWPAGWIALMAAAHLLLQKIQASRGFRFFVFYFLTTAFIVLPSDWANLTVIPQPRRVHLEMEMALAGVVTYPPARLWERAALPLRVALGVTLALLCVIQLRNYRAYAREITRPVDIENTIEYREAKWFEHHLPGARVFVPGSVDMWMNAFSDSPQMVGCCDQGVPTVEHRIAFYTVLVRDQQGNRETEISPLWLKAYGAAAVAVSGPRSTETVKPYTTPTKFEGALPVLWRDGDDAIYQVTPGPHSLAHVIRPDQEVRRAPIHGLDVEPLRPFVAALEDPSLPRASFQWLNQHQARIETRIEPGQILSLQVSYAPGWRAEANGAPARVHADALGLTIVEPHCTGPCTVMLTYDGAAEARWTRVAQWLGVILCVVWPLALPPARKPLIPAPRTAR